MRSAYSNVSLSSEISKYSKLYDSLTIKFTDDANTYTPIEKKDNVQ